VHSTQSDGAGTRDEIAAAASRAGLQFVVFADHGDGTREPDPPKYSQGVLCLDGVEVSTDGGHYVALGLPKAPYRLGGEVAGVVEDVARLGGFGVIAHPDSPKPELAWSDWKVSGSGLEWLSADSAWREISWPRLVWTTLQYLTRPAAALAGSLGRPGATLARWDSLAQQRPVPVLAGHDAHGGALNASYQAAFASFSTRAVLRQPLSGDAEADGAQLLEALRQGRAYTVLDGLGRNGWLDLRAREQETVEVVGGRLEGLGPITLTARAPTLPGSRLLVLRNGHAVSDVAAGQVRLETYEPGAYRVEVRLPGRDAHAPWILSNPVYVGLRAPPRSNPPVIDPVKMGETTWRSEHDPSSSGTVAGQPARPELRFQLGTEAASPFAALVAPLPAGADPFDLVVLDVTSSSPMRISLQFRSTDGATRWRKSVYVSPHGGQSWVRTSELTSVPAPGVPFNPGAAGSVLLVVDLVNAIPGSSGFIRLEDLAFARIR
jgi:hypothetical protein